MKISSIFPVLAAVAFTSTLACPTHRSHKSQHVAKASKNGSISKGSKAIVAQGAHHGKTNQHAGTKKKHKGALHKGKTTSQKGTTPVTKGASAGSVGSTAFDKQTNFLGFSYDITACQPASQLATDWANMKKLGARNTRLYGTCDQPGYLTKVLTVSKENDMGLIPLVWFGFNGGDQWKTRAAAIVSAIKAFPGASDIVRGVAFGDEPLLDMPLSVNDLATQVSSMAAELKSLNIPVATSDMAYSYQSNGNAPQVFKANEVLYAHALPFFDNNAQSGGSPEAWQSVQATIAYFKKYGGDKPITLTQTGWPSNEDIWKPNNAAAVASVSSEAAYYGQLWSNCKYFTENNIGWFAQLYEDSMLSGWGTTDNGKPKFAWKIVTSC